MKEEIGFESRDWPNGETMEKKEHDELGFLDTRQGFQSFVKWKYYGLRKKKNPFGLKVL